MVRGQRARTQAWMIFGVISDGSLFVLAESVIQKASLFCIVFIFVFLAGDGMINHSVF